MSGGLFVDLGGFRRYFGLCKFWCQFDDCALDIVRSVLWVELVPVVEVGHHAAHDFEAVGVECPSHVTEVVDAGLGGV